MTPGTLALLAGLFLVPAALLWAGHRMRRRSARWRSAFWGALIAHLAVSPLAMLAAMIPAAAWAPHDRWRGFLGLWALLVGPALGALIGSIRVRRTDGDVGA